jgi:hypothetical protein
MFKSEIEVDSAECGPLGLCQKSQRFHARRLRDLRNNLPPEWTRGVPKGSVTPGSYPQVHGVKVADVRHIISESKLPGEGAHFISAQGDGTGYNGQHFVHKILGYESGIYKSQSWDIYILFIENYSTLHSYACSFAVQRSGYIMRFYTCVRMAEYNSGLWSKLSCELSSIPLSYGLTTN